jgi:hypothetical protein
MIYFNVKLEEGDTVYELLQKGFVGNYGMFITTFNQEPNPDYDEDDYTHDSIQCYNANRSFLDLLEICQTYFPESTENDLKKALIRGCEDENFKLYTIFCDDIEEWVFFKGTSPYDHITRMINSTLEPKGLTARNRLEAIGISRHVECPEDRHCKSIDTRGSRSEISLVDICTVDELQVCI